MVSSWDRGFTVDRGRFRRHISIRGVGVSDFLFKMGERYFFEEQNKLFGIYIGQMYYIVQRDSPEREEAAVAVEQPDLPLTA